MQNISTYQNLKSINIITFWEISETSNYALMDINYSEDKQYTEEELNYLQISFLTLYDEYYKVKNSSRQRSMLKENDKYTKQAYKIYLLEELLKNIKVLISTSKVIDLQDYAELLKETYDNIVKVEPNIKLKPLDNDNNIDKIERVIKSLKNQLELNDKRAKQDIKKEVSNPYDNIANVERVLERSLGDIDKINVLQWLAYEKQVEQIINSKKVNNGR